MHVSRFASWIIFTFPLLATAGGEIESPFRAVRCEGYYPKHLQGICTNDKGAIYWCFTDNLVKTDTSGAVTKKVRVANHHGDLCYHQSSVYVAVNLGKFNEHGSKADSWIYVYDGETLAEFARYKIPEVVYGAGGIGVRDGRYFVVGGLPKNVRENYVYEYDDKFKFIRRHILKTGNTSMGIQTIEFAADRWWFGCYGDPRLLFKSDANFSLTGRWNHDASLGLVGIPNRRLLVARGAYEKNKGYSGSVDLCVSSPASGFELVDDREASSRARHWSSPPATSEEVSVDWLNDWIEESLAWWKSYLKCDEVRPRTAQSIETHIKAYILGTRNEEKYWDRRRPWRYRYRIRMLPTSRSADVVVIDDFIELLCTYSEGGNEYEEVQPRRRERSADHAWLFHAEPIPNWAFKVLENETEASSFRNSVERRVEPIEPASRRLLGQTSDGRSLTLFDSGLEMETVAKADSIRRVKGFWLTAAPGVISRHLPVRQSAEPWSADVPSSAEIESARTSWSNFLLGRVKTGDNIAVVEDTLNGNFIDRCKGMCDHAADYTIAYVVDDFLQVRCFCDREGRITAAPVIERRVPWVKDCPEVAFAWLDMESFELGFKKPDSRPKRFGRHFLGPILGGGGAGYPGIGGGGFGGFGGISPTPINSQSN